MLDVLSTDVIIPLLAGLVAGWLGGIVTRGSGFGVAGNCVTGILGAFAAAYLARFASETAAQSMILTGISALIGAFLLLAAIGEMRRS